MRIQIISLMEGFSWGGSEELWFKVALSSLERGHEIQVCKKHFNPEPDKIKFLRGKGISIVKRISRFNIVYRLINRLSLAFFKRQFIQGLGYIEKLHSFNADVILVSCGGTLDLFYHEPLYDYLNRGRGKIVMISQFYGEHTKIPDFVAERMRQSLYLWQKFYFVAQRNLLTVERHLACSIPNAEIIDNPVNISDVSVAAWPKVKRLSMACIARYDIQYKGQDLLIQALSSNEFISKDYILNLFGSGPDRSYLISLIKYYGLEDKIIVNDFVKDIDQVWENHHVLLLPSLAEGTSLVLQECMLKGRPALATDVGGSGTLVLDGTTGFLAHPLSVDALKGKLKELFDTSLNDMKQLGINAFNHANKKINLNSDQIIVSEIECVE